MNGERDAAVAELLRSLEAAVAIEEESWCEAQEGKARAQSLQDALMARLRGASEDLKSAPAASLGRSPEEDAARLGAMQTRTAEGVTALCDASDALLCLAAYPEARPGVRQIAGLLRAARLADVERDPIAVPPMPSRDPSLLDRMHSESAEGRSAARRAFALDFFERMEPFRTSITGPAEARWERKRRLLAEALEAARALADRLATEP